jgi:ornithine cyclodeaminase/alanine dehydrogenase-like protein (mu-crystallin family)
LALYLTEEDVKRLVTPAVAVEAVEESFRRLAGGEIENVPRYRVRLDGGALAVMSAVDRERHLACVKTYTVTGEGAAFVVVLFEGPEARALIEADGLGQLRTGAATAVAAKHLARADARTLGVIGCGKQARTQVVCIREALPAIERVVAYCRTEKGLKAFCREVDAWPGESHRDPAEQDIVVTITTSRDPVLRGEWLQPGALVCAVGANRSEARELDNAVLERASFVCCDSLADAKLESGDLIEPVEQGVLDWLEVHELQEVVVGDLSGRQADEDIVVFKSNGLAAWDLAVASRAVELAR